MLVRPTAESTANVNPHYLSRLPSERGLKRDVPAHARIYFRVPLVRRLRPATDAFWWPKRPPPEISGCFVLLALSRKILEFFEEFLWQEWMRNWLDIKLNFFLVVESRIFWEYLSKRRYERDILRGEVLFTRIGKMVWKNFKDPRI